MRVEQARARQQARGFYNAQIPVCGLPKLCALDDAGERTLERWRCGGWDYRRWAHDRILTVARTIADQLSRFR